MARASTWAAVGGWMVAMLGASPAGAQSTNYSDVPDRFRLELGGFRVGSDTELTFSRGGDPAVPVDFEQLNLPNNATQGYVELFWRPGRRHLVSLSFFRNNRSGDPKSVEREFTWGDQVVTVGSTARAEVNSHYLSGAYRFAAYKNDRFEIGPSIGIGYLSIEAGITGDVHGAAGGASGSRSFDVGKDLGQPTGDVGAYLYFWPAKRLLMRGDFRYILVKPEDAEASVTEGRAAALYHPWKNFGFGLQYTYSKFRYDRDNLATELGGTVRYSGGQVVISAAF